MISFIRLAVVAAILTVLTSTVQAQTASQFYGGAHGESLAHTTSLFQGLPGIYGNIAGLAYVDGFAADVSYDSRYGLTELSTASFSGAYGGSNGTIGLLVSKYGFDSYAEHKVGVAYARKLSSKLSLGGMLDLLQYSIDGFGTTNKITFEVGMYAELTKQLHLGVAIFSPGTVSLGDVQTLPSRMALGLRYNVTEKADILLEVTKIADRPAEIKFAMDYHLQSNIGVRLGSNVTQSTIHFGAFANINEDIRVLAAYSYNNLLGNTPSISLTYGGIVSPSPVSRR